MVSFPDPEGAEATIKAAKLAQLGEFRDGDSQVRTPEGQARVKAHTHRLAAIKRRYQPQSDGGDTQGDNQPDGGGSEAGISVPVGTDSRTFSPELNEAISQRIRDKEGEDDNQPTTPEVAE